MASTLHALLKGHEALVHLSQLVKSRPVSAEGQASVGSPKSGLSLPWYVMSWLFQSLVLKRSATSDRHNTASVTVIGAGITFDFHPSHESEPS